MFINICTALVVDERIVCGMVLKETNKSIWEKTFLVSIFSQNSQMDWPGIKR
jgi:hypothetical protein